MTRNTLNCLAIVFLGVACAALSLTLACKQAEAQPGDLIEYHSLGTISGSGVGYFDHGSNRCYVRSTSGISCVVRAK